MEDAEEAVRALTELGLTEYEARCFVALTRITQGTAKEISEVSGVPRSRVYDTVERLHQRGLVAIQRSEPQEFRSIPPDEAAARLREDHESHLEAAENALVQIKAPDSEVDQGMWAITDHEHVADRQVALVEKAEESVHFLITADGTLEDRILDALAAASARGVHTVVEVPTEALAERVHEAVPDARIVVAPGLAATKRVIDERPGTLVLIDERAAIATGIEESDLPGVTREAAMWTHGNDHGFAVWVRELLADRLSEE